jgi:hypothetical protein
MVERTITTEGIVAKLTSKTAGKSTRSSSRVAKTAAVTEPMPPPPTQPDPSDSDEFVMASKPFSDSLKRISEQAKDWGYMARPMAVVNGSKPAARLDDIHGLIAEKIRAVPTPIPLSQPAVSWGKWACVLSLITLFFSLTQFLWMQRQSVILHEVQMEQMSNSFQRLHASLGVIRGQMKKKTPTVSSSSPAPLAHSILPSTTKPDAPSKRLAAGDMR